MMDLSQRNCNSRSCFMVFKDP